MSITIDFPHSEDQLLVSVVYPADTWPETIEVIARAAVIPRALDLNPDSEADDFLLDTWDDDECDGYRTTVFYVVKMPNLIRR